MAKRKRHKMEFEIEDVNLLPIMNLITLLIPFLLLSAQFIQIGVILVEPPRISSGGSSGGPNNANQPEKRELNLTVVVTGDGFSVNYKPNGTPVSLCPEKGKQPCIKAKMVGGKKTYDGHALQKLLFERVWKPFMKRNSLEPDKMKSNLFKDWGRVAILANDDIPYEVIVKVLDATREFPPEAKGVVSGRLACEFKKPLGEDEWVMKGNCMFPFAQISSQ